MSSFSERSAALRAQKERIEKMWQEALEIFCRHAEGGNLTEMEKLWSHFKELTRDGPLKCDLATKIRTAGGRGEQAIHCAADHGAVKAIEWLVAHGADLRARDGNGWTIMHHAAVCDQPEAIHWMKLRGLDIDAKDNDGCTPLQRVHMSGGKKETIAQLISDGAKDR